MNVKTIKRQLFLVLLVLPIVFLIIGLRFDRTTFGTDPESAYLMNGLNIATLKPVGHYDNPGTPVQIYSAIVIRVVHFFKFTNTDIETDVLTHSESYIEVLRFGLIILNFLVILLAGVLTYALLNSIWLSLLIQIAPFLSTTLIEELYTKVAPEPVLFATAMCLGMLLLLFYQSGNKQHAKYAIYFGVLSGFGLATKMTFLPLLIIPLLILPLRKNKLIYLGLIVPSFILFTLPAARGYANMAGWFLNLSSHTGTYGQGGKGVIDTAAYLHSLKAIVINNLALIFTLFFLLLTLVFGYLKYRKQNNKRISFEFRILLALFIALTGSIFMVAKHYHSNHYLFPALSLIGISWVFIYIYFGSILSIKNSIKGKVVAPFLVIIFLVVSFFNIPYLKMAYGGYRLSNQDTQQTLQRVENDYAQYVKVYYYPVSFNLYSSLRWGNVYSRQVHTDALMRIFPEGLFFNGWDKSFQFWETSIPASDFVKKYGSKILLIGGPRNPEEMKLVNDCGIILKKLYEGRVQVFYEVDTMNSQLFKIIANRVNPKWKLENDFELSSPDQKWIMDGANQFCKSDFIAADKVRSGKNSLKLPWNDSYGMDFLLKNVKPGDIYEASIWRYGGEDASLVATAQNTGKLYVASQRGIETDASGWQKLVVEFTVPEDFTEQNIKIYLWNHSNKVAWFDDFRIEKF